MASSSELACAYAALILHDDDVAVTGDKIASILKAADIEFEAFWPNLFAKAVGTKDIGALIFNIGSGGGGAPAAAPAAGGAAPAAAAAAPAAKEPEPEEEEEDMGFGLFD